MIKRIVGGVVTVLIGGSVYTVSQTDIAKNFAHETGMSQQQAEKYVNDSQKDLESFSKIGNDLVSDSNTISSTVSGIDCINYEYEWESDTLSCDEGKSELQTIGTDELTMGNCYIALDTDLKTTARSKISECISDIDILNASYDLPIASSLLSISDVTDIKNSNLYNKSVLETALQSKQ